MAGYADTRELIINTLMGRPAGTEIQPEDHQAFALQITEYIRQVELVAGSGVPVAFAEPNTVPIQPDNGNAVYLSYVPRSTTKNFVNFINQSGNSISVTSSSGEVKLVTLLWNGSYWSTQIVTINVLSDDSSVNASNIGASDYILFSASSNYSIGDIVRYDGKLYKFTSAHAAGNWLGTDVELASINSILTSKLTELESEVQFQHNTLYGGSYSKSENNIIGQRTRYITLGIKQGEEIEVYFESSASLHCMLGVNFSDGTSNGGIATLTNNNPHVYIAEKDVTNILFYIQEAGDIETFAMYVNINNNLPSLYTKADNNEEKITTIDNNIALIAVGDIRWEEGYYDYATGSQKSASFYRRTQKFVSGIEDLFTELPLNESNAFISLWKSGVYVGFRQNGNFYSPISRPNESAIVPSIEYDEFAFSVVINKIPDYLTRYQLISIKSLSQSPLNIGFWSGKKIGFLGDSITAGIYFDANGGHTAERPYCIACCEELNAISINYGVSGTSISSTSATSPSSAFIHRYSGMADDLDMIVVLGGTNDFSNGKIGRAHV